MEDKLCDYGCGQPAKFYFAKAKKHCCASHYRSCPYQASTIGAKRLGKKHTDDTKAKIGAKTKQRLEENGGSYFKGRSHTDETKQLISEKVRGRVSWSKGLTSETDIRVAKLTAFKRANPHLYANVGSDNGMFGRTHTDEVKQKIRDANRQSGRWVGEDNPWYGVDRSGQLSPRFLPEETRREWKTYRGQARYWTDITYNQHATTINPNNLPRGIREYHIDHIVPLWYGFIHGIDPKLLSNKENLRMLWYKDNLSRKKDIS